MHIIIIKSLLSQSIINHIRVREKQQSELVFSPQNATHHCQAAHTDSSIQMKFDVSVDQVRHFFFGDSTSSDDNK